MDLLPDPDPKMCAVRGGDAPHCFHWSPGGATWKGAYAQQTHCCYCAYIGLARLEGEAAAGHGPYQFLRLGEPIGASAVIVSP